MLSSVPRQDSPLRRPAIRIPTVCVVDPQVDDYQGWNSLAQEGEVRLHLVATADEALRFSRANSVDLWVINAELPSLGGHELCGMLKAHHAQATVFMLANEYSSTAEQLAWTNRATLFGAKPEHHSWLSLWMSERARRSATRSAA